MVFKKVSDYLKIHFPNVYIVIVSGLITLWFHSFNQVAAHYLPKGGVITKWMILLTITFLLYIGDGSLNELYSFDHPESVTATIQNEVDENKQKLSRANKVMNTRSRTR